MTREFQVNQKGVQWAFNGHGFDLPGLCGAGSVLIDVGGKM